MRLHCELLEVREVPAATTWQSNGTWSNGAPANGDTVLVKWDAPTLVLAAGLTLDELDVEDGFTDTIRVTGTGVGLTIGSGDIYDATFEMDSNEGIVITEHSVGADPVRFYDVTVTQGTGSGATSPALRVDGTGYLTIYGDGNSIAGSIKVDNNGYLILSGVLTGASGRYVQVYGSFYMSSWANGDPTLSTFDHVTAYRGSLAGDPGGRVVVSTNAIATFNCPVKTASTGSGGIGIVRVSDGGYAYFNDNVTIDGGRLLLEEGSVSTVATGKKITVTGGGSQLVVTETRTASVADVDVSVVGNVELINGALLDFEEITGQDVDYAHLAITGTLTFGTCSVYMRVHKDYNEKSDKITATSVSFATGTTNLYVSSAGTSSGHSTTLINTVNGFGGGSFDNISTSLTVGPAGSPATAYVASW